MGFEPKTCDYCWRDRIAVIHLQQGMFRTLFGLPERTRYVCRNHLRRDDRPGRLYA
jgi:hypothetical protein